ncbi:MAG: hypothetical protein GY797_23345 [Deltaproteobacteria bacterium]|nr:hypothetical protein [Deltaproteobacteria bacterium]
MKITLQILIILTLLSCQLTLPGNGKPFTSTTIEFDLFATRTPLLVEAEDSPHWSPNGQQLAIECYLSGPTEEIAGSGGLRRYTIEAADICIIDHNGKNRIQVTTQPGADRYPTWSPAGQWIAYTRLDGIHLIKPNGLGHRHLVSISNTHQIDQVNKVTWSADGTQILFSACFTNDTNYDVYVVDVKTGALTNLTSKSDRYNFKPVWALNDEKIFFESYKPFLDTQPCSRRTKDLQLKMINRNGSDEQVIYNQQENLDTLYPYSISISNDGHIAFISGEHEFSTSGDIYTMRFDEREPIKTPLKAARLYSWSSDGKRLFTSYLEIFNIETGEIQKLTWPGGINDTSWSPDGQKIAVAGRVMDLDFFYKNYIY